MTAVTLPRLVASVLVLAAWSAQADIMDEVDVRREGNNAVLQIRLSAPISLLRSTVSRTRELTQAYYQVRSRDAAPVYVAGERRVVQSDGLPSITIEDEPVRADNLADPNRRLVIKFSQTTRFKVRAGKGDRAIEVVLEGLGAAVKAPSSSRLATPALPEQRYVIALARASDPKVGIDMPVPQSLQSYQVFTTSRVIDGQQVHEVDLGYFATLAGAEAALKLLGRFPQALIVKLSDKTDATGTAGASPAPTAAVTPAPQPGDQTPADMLQRSRQAYEQQRLDDAAQALGQLLDLPPSPVTQEAQELMGQVRLAQGDTGRAQAEFEAYLKQYPTGPGADRVKAALAGLQQTDLKLTSTLDAVKRPERVTTLTGSVSQYYYGGKSTFASQAVRNTDGTLLSPDEVARNSKSPISSDDQQQLTTNVDTTWRSRDAEKDIRLVVRDQYDYNMLDESRLRGKSRHRNRLTAAYMDYQGLQNGVRSRLGRQSAMWGGEGRYDGASASYVFKPKWKASVAAGVPTDVLAKAKRQFTGLSLDADALTPNIGASVFTLQRMIDGEVDRRSAGADLRYFTQSASLMGSTDYDIVFNKLNVASLQGMYLGENNTTLNVLYERRSLSPASLGQTLFFQFKELSEANIQPQTINDLKARGYTVAQLRELVRNNTSYWTHAMASVTTSLSAQWQGGIDVHLNRTGAIAPNPVLPDGQAASGQQRTLGVQAIGSNLYSERDTHVFAGSLTNSSQFKVRQISYNNMTPLNEAWQIEPGLRWQRNVSKDIGTGLNITTTAWGPGFKASFKPRPTVTLETNLNVDYTRTEGVTSTDQSTRYTYFLGYRYDY